MSAKQQQQQKRKWISGEWVCEAARIVNPPKGSREVILQKKPTVPAAPSSTQIGFHIPPLQIMCTHTHNEEEDSSEAALQD